MNVSIVSFSSLQELEVKHESEEEAKVEAEISHVLEEADMEAHAEERLA